MIAINFQGLLRLLLMIVQIKSKSLKNKAFHYYNMILESIIKNFELKQKTLLLMLAGTLSALGCATGVTEENLC